MKSQTQSTTGTPLKLSIFKWWVQRNRRWLLGLLGVIVAWHALHGVGWAEVWALVARISPIAILTIVGINLFMLPFMAARWWLLLKTLGSPVSLLSITAYRTAANSVNYLTPGPHFGGEPLSVYLLHHRHGTPLSSAATSVAVDRLLELLASFIVLSLCLLKLTFDGTGPFTRESGLILVITVLLLFTIMLTVLFSGGKPLSKPVYVLMRFCRRYFPAISFTTGTWIDIIDQCEVMAESLFHSHRFQFLFANFLSILHWVAVFAEFWLMSWFLGYPLSLLHLSAVVVVARLAFFTPLPAGIGVLESALPWMTASLGLGDILGVSLCLIIRCRDLVFSMIGLGLAMKYLTCQKKVGIIDNMSGCQGVNDLLKKQ
ncbi:MAG: lysylphosphatidylglycerol synthase transmembrane domain-containing protein [Desulforhopalus sp.]